MMHLKISKHLALVYIPSNRCILLKEDVLSLCGHFGTQMNELRKSTPALGLAMNADWLFIHSPLDEMNTSLAASSHQFSSEKLFVDSRLPAPRA
jgi:hypothetical protein